MVPFSIHFVSFDPVKNIAHYRLQKEEGTNIPTKGYAMSKMPPKSNNAQAYVVEKIINKRKRKGQIQYHIKWAGFGDDQNTWEPKSNILDTALIYNFEQENTRAKRLKRQRKQIDNDRDIEAKSATSADDEVTDDNRHDATGVSQESINGTFSLTDVNVDSTSDGYSSPTFEPTAGPSSTSGRHSSPPKTLLKRYRVTPDGSVEKVATRPVYVHGTQRPSRFAAHVQSEDAPAAENQASSTTTTTAGLSPAGPGHGVPMEAAVAETIPDRVQWRNVLSMLEPVAYWSVGLVVHTEVTVQSETISIQECKTNIGFFKSDSGQT